MIVHRNKDFSRTVVLCEFFISNIQEFKKSFRWFHEPEIYTKYALARSVNQLQRENEKATIL